MNVLVDTSALCAVLDGNDERHAEAVATWSELLTGSLELFTTNHVLVETVALAQTRMGMEAVNDVCSDLLPVIRTICVDEAMRRAGPRVEFCLDPHFAEQWFRALPA